MRLHNALRDSLIVIAITCAILLAMELSLRALYPEKIEDKVSLSSLIYQHNDNYIISLKPGITKEFKVSKENGGGVISWGTNSLGFRGEEIAEKTGLRIIVYGDSNIQARFTQHQNTFTTVLQTLLGREHNNVEVINAGLVGAGTDQNLIRLSEELDSIKPDIVIFHVFADNDFGDIVRNRLFELSATGELVKTDYKITMDQELSSREPTFINWVNSLLIVRAVQKLATNEIDVEALNENEKVETILKDLIKQSEIEFDVYRKKKPRQASHFADHYDIDIAIDPESDSARTKIMLMEKVLLQANKLASTKQAIFLVVVQPSVFDLTIDRFSFGYKDLEKYEHYKQENLSKPFKQICEKHTLNCVHLVDFFLREGPDDLYRKNDNHWNDMGQRISAEATAEKIHALLK